MGMAQNFDGHKILMIKKIKPQKFTEVKSVSLLVGNTSANELSSMHNNYGSQKERVNKPLNVYVVRVLLLSLLAAVMNVFVFSSLLQI